MLRVDDVLFKTSKLSTSVKEQHHVPCKCAVAEGCHSNRAGYNLSAYTQPTSAFNIDGQQNILMFNLCGDERGIA